MSTQVEIAEAKAIERMYIFKICKHIGTSKNSAIKRLADGSDVISCICKRLKGNEDAIRLMHSKGGSQASPPTLAPGGACPLNPFGSAPDGVMWDVAWLVLDEALCRGLLSPGCVCALCVVR